MATSNNTKVTFYDGVQFTGTSEGIVQGSGTTEGGVYFTDPSSNGPHHIAHGGRVYTMGPDVKNGSTKTVDVVPNNFNNEVLRQGATGNLFNATNSPQIQVVESVTSDKWGKVLSINTVTLNTQPLLNVLNALTSAIQGIDPIPPSPLKPNYKIGYIDGNNVFQETNSFTQLITGITLNPSSATNLTAGDTQQFTATANYTKSVVEVYIASDYPNTITSSGWEKEKVNVSNINSSWTVWHKTISVSETLTINGENNFTCSEKINVTQQTLSINRPWSLLTGTAAVNPLIAKIINDNATSCTLTTLGKLDDAILKYEFNNGKTIITAQASITVKDKPVTTKYYYYAGWECPTNETELANKGTLINGDVNSFTYNYATGGNEVSNTTYGTVYFVIPSQLSLYDNLGTDIVADQYDETTTTIGGVTYRILASKEEFKKMNFLNIKKKQ